MRSGNWGKRLLRSFVTRHQASGPAVSVIMPVFRTEDYLADSLTSVLRQSCRDIEVIVVDDASPGDVSAIVASVAGGDSRVRMVRHAKNQGILAARLTGSKLATGTYLTFVDSDDLIEHRFVQTLHEAAIRYNADLVQCGITVVEADGRIWHLNRGGPAHQNHGSSVLAELLAGKMSNSVANKLTRTSCWHAATAHLVRTEHRFCFGEDLLCLFLVAARSRHYAHVPDAAYRYIRRAGSATTGYSDTAIIRQMEDLSLIYAEISRHMEIFRVSEDLKSGFASREFISVMQEIIQPSGSGPGTNLTALPDWPHRFGMLGALVAASLGE
jgi:glycosyltransferase involved in cell wall biosynthesis